jgi:hypothetical protein
MSHLPRQVTNFHTRHRVAFLEVEEEGPVADSVDDSTPELMSDAGSEPSDAYDNLPSQPS